jgi:GST-like protein
MAFAIYGDYRTGVFCVEAALAEAGADYVFERVRFRGHEQKSPAFLAVNPSGKVPALKFPEGTILTESLAILLAIADRFPDAHLLPGAGSVARAQAFRWLAFMAGEVYPMVEIADYPERFASAGEEAEKLRAKAHARIQENLLIVENAAQEPWFLGGQFSLVDIYVVMFTRWGDSIGKGWVEAGHIPKLLALAERLSRRERIAPVWNKHFQRNKA